MIVVMWTLLFTPAFGGTVEQLRSAKFETPAAAEIFVKRAPTEAFECVDSFRGQNGNCLVKEIWIQGNKQEEK